MTSLREAIGKPVILRETAEKIGAVGSFAIDAATQRVTGLVVSAGRTSRVIDWAQIQSIGPDAVIVETSREPAADDERIVSGAANPLEKRVLSDLGNELGKVTDATVDDDGSIENLDVADHQLGGSRLKGVGSYAVVLAADPGEA